MIDQASVGSLQLRDRCRPHFPKFRQVVGIESEIGQFLGVGFEMIEFFDFAFDQGADVLVTTARQGDPPWDFGGFVEDLRVSGYDIGIGPILLSGESRQNGMFPFSIRLMKACAQLTTLVYFVKYVRP